MPLEYIDGEPKLCNQIVSATCPSRPAAPTSETRGASERKGEERTRQKSKARKDRRGMSGGGGGESGRGRTPSCQVDLIA